MTQHPQNGGMTPVPVEVGGGEGGGTNVTEEG